MSSNNFISGIYNYCDRWCENCSYTDKCFLYRQEAEMEIKRILKDKDSADAELSAKDIEDSFRETLKLLNDDDSDSHSEANFGDIDFESEEDSDDDSGFFSNLNNTDNDEEVPSFGLSNIKHPLIDLTNNLFNDFSNYYDLVKVKYPAEVENKNSESVFQQNLETLGWFTPQILVKSKMCVWSKKNLERVDNELQKKIDEDIQNVNCRIAFVGIEKIINALDNILKLKPNLQSETKELRSLAKIIKDLFIAEFPNTTTYKRPYFD